MQAAVPASASASLPAQAWHGEAWLKPLRLSVGGVPAGLRAAWLWQLGATCWLQFVSL